MNLRYRPTTPEDFPDCIDLMYGRFAFDNGRRRHLAQLWGEALSGGQGVSALVENTSSSSHARRVLGFGLNVFVTDEFVGELRSGALPYFATHTLDRWLAGRSPILSREAVRRANSGAGLNILCLSVGHLRPPEVTVEAFHDVIRAMMAAGVAMHRGYQVKEVLAEACGAADRDMLLAGGFDLRADFRDHYARQPVPPTISQWPYLLGLTRAECVALPFHMVSHWFDYTPSRFGLRAAEQSMLRHALEGATDEDIAEKLSLSIWTIKKRWQVIYGKAEGSWPQFLEVATQATSARGPERRRYLLNYLRDHPEELRP